MPGKNPLKLNVLQLKTLTILHPIGAMLPAEALAYDTGLADKILHRSDH